MFKILYNKNPIKIILFIVILIKKLKIIKNQESLFIRNLDMNYTHALSLINGNIFILHEKGVKVYNYNFTIVLYNLYFDGIKLIQSEYENNLTTLFQCDDDNKQYVFAIIYNKIFIFSSRGEYLFSLSNTCSNFTSNEYMYNYYSFLYYKHIDDNYYFINSYLNQEYKIELNELKINMDMQTINCTKRSIYIENNISSSISCQLMIKSNY